MKNSSSSGNIPLNQDKDTYMSLPYNKTSICLSANDSVTSKSNGGIPMAGIVVAKNKAIKTATNMEVDDKFNSKEVFEKELAQKSYPREQRKGLANLKESYDSIIEDLGTDTGKARESEGSKKKGKSKLRTELEAQNEAINNRIKRLHISYKKKEAREDITMKFFSFDWFADSLSKYSVGTPYINY
jgi:hypothetical protein